MSSDLVSDSPQSLQLSVSGISVNYDAFAAVDDISFCLNKGDIACLLGPSGCGKSTLLRAIAGFEALTKGEIHLVDRLLSSKNFMLVPELRSVGLVFQDFALFPHLNTEQNIAFGLQGFADKEKKTRVAELLELTDLRPFSARYPHELSGGQQQRVALARALASRPKLLLMDEPFSSLDGDLREKIAEDVRRLLKDLQITSILVTHDQLEAFAVADTVGVMNEGKILQWDTPYNLYHKPEHRFVAGFVGDGAIIRLRADGKAQLDTGIGVFSNPTVEANTDYELLIRPDDVRHDPSSHIQLPILAKRFRGAENYFDLLLPHGEKITCIAPSHINPAVGEMLSVRTDLKHLILFKK